MNSPSPFHNVNVDAAARECLEECGASSQPELCLAAYLLTLRADPAWEEADVRLLEAAVCRALATAHAAATVGRQSRAAPPAR
jgi:hypothetical protein